jgi:hypothetical protein
VRRARVGGGHAHRMTQKQQQGGGDGGGNSRRCQGCSGCAECLEDVARLAEDTAAEVTVPPLT